MKRVTFCAFFFAAAFALFFASCSQAAPEIQAASLRLLYREGGTERLSFFALVADEDGMIDLEELHLLHDERQLYWTLTEADWIKVEKPGETWVGSHSLVMHDELAFPRGTYRAVLIDKGGDRAERQAVLTAPARPRSAFPRVAFSGGRYRVTSTYPEHTLIVYDPSGATVKTVQLKAKEGTLADLGLPPNARSAAILAEDDETGVAAFTEAVPLP